MSSVRDREEAVQELRSALEEVDNPVAAARALRRVGASFEPEAETSWDAFRLAATRALEPHLDGNARAVVWAVLDGVREDGRRDPGGGSLDFLDVEWGDPLPLAPPAPESYPLAALPEWVRRHVESVAQHTQTPSDLAFLLSLSALSVGVANKVRLQVRPGHNEPGHFWGAIILPPGSRKSAVFRQMIRPILDYEAEVADKSASERRKLANEREVVEKSLENAKREAAKASTNEEQGKALGRLRDLQERLEGLEVPAPPRLVASDVTGEKLARLMADHHGRIAILAPEGDLFRVMAGRYSGGLNFDHYKRAWTGDEPIRDDRMGREGSHVRRPALTMGLTLQPSVLQSLEEKESFRGEGLLGRFIYAVPESGIGGRLTGADVPALDSEAADGYERTLRRVLQLEPRDIDDGGEFVPHELDLSPGARGAYFAFEGEVETMMGPGGRLEHVLDWAAKLPGHVCRTAVLLHVAARVGENLSPWEAPVSERAMRRAIATGRAGVPHALQVFDALEMDEDLRLARYLLRRIRELSDSGDPPSTSDLLQVVKQKRGLGTAEDLDSVLAVLEAHRLVRRVERPADGRGRPPSPMVAVNPKATTSNVQEIQETPETEDNLDLLDAERGEGDPGPARAGGPGDEPKDLQADLGSMLEGDQ